MGKKKAKPSEQIACFLNFVDECERIYQTAYEQVGMEDKRVQDLLHEVEFARGASERNRAAARLQESRRWRRENKDTAQYYKCVVEFFHEKGNRNTLNQMRQLLGRQRKEEEYLGWIFLCGSTAVPEERIPPVQRQETAVPEQRYRT